MELVCDTGTGEKMGHFASRIVKAIELNKCYKYEEISPVGDGNNGGDRSRDKSGQIGKSGQRYGGKLPNFLKRDPVSS